MKKLNPIAITRLDELTPLFNHDDIDLQSPAALAITDFKYAPPLMIESSTLAQQAVYMLDHAHVEATLVVDSRDLFLGIISRDQLSLQNQLSKAATGIPLEDLNAGHLMIPATQLKTLSFEEISNSKIADLVQTLSQQGIQYCVIIDSDRTAIRGLASVDAIAKKLNTTIELRRSPNFSEIYNDIHV